MTIATANAKAITNAYHTTDITYLGGTVAFTTAGGGVLHDTPSNGGVAEPREPYNQLLEPAVTESPDVVAQMFSIISAGGQPRPLLNLATNSASSRWDRNGDRQ